MTVIIHWHYPLSAVEPYGSLNITVIVHWHYPLGAVEPYGSPEVLFNNTAGQS